jgi:hypothetical protein
VRADLAVNVHGRSGKAFVRSLGADAKRVEGKTLYTLANRHLERIERIVAPQWNRVRQREVGDAEHSGQPIPQGLPGNIFTKGDANAPLERLDLSDPEITKASSQVANQTLLKERPVSSFESEFMVVDDRATHH